MNGGIIGLVSTDPVLAKGMQINGRIRSVQNIRWERCMGTEHAANLGTILDYDVAPEATDFGTEP